MPKQFARHDSRVTLETEIDALWRDLDAARAEIRRQRSGSTSGGLVAATAGDGADLRMVFFALGQPEAVVYTGP